MFIGIDVAKAELVVSVQPTLDRFRVENTAEGIDLLVSKLRALTPTLIVLEATGGYQLRSVAALVAASLPVVVVNPRQVRDFARRLGSWRRRIGLMPTSSRASPTSSARRFAHRSRTRYRRFA